MTKEILHLPGERVYIPTCSPLGHILFGRGSPNRGIWAIPFSLSTLTVTGEPFPVARDGAYPSVSADETLLYQSRAPLHMAAGEVGPYQLVWVDRNGKVEGIIGQPQDQMREPAASPDGGLVAVTETEKGSWDIWIHDAARGTKTRLTLDPKVDWRPAWSPSGDRIAFGSGTFEKTEIYIKASDGSGEPRALAPGQSAGYVNWSKDGKNLTYGAHNEGSGWDLWRLPVNDGGEPELLLRTPANERHPRISPNGRYMAYVSDESGQHEVYVRLFPTGEGRVLVSTNGGLHPKWNDRGDELFYVGDNTLMAVNVETEPIFRADIPRKLFTGEQVGTQLTIFTQVSMYDVAPDGQRFVVVQPVGKKPSISVVQNWSAEFKK
jgi:Tol biopolymer transport system component